jgi:predicted histone-like DNA-binding protein
LEKRQDVKKSITARQPYGQQYSSTIQNKKVMSVKFKIKKLVNPTSEKNGYYYPRAVITDAMDLDAVAEKIQDNSSMRKSDVKAVIEELISVVKEAIQDGKKVQLDGFGSFRLGLRSTAVPSVADFTQNAIKGFHVIFQPEMSRDKSGNVINALTLGAKAAAYEEYEAGVNDNK